MPQPESHPRSAPPPPAPLSPTAAAAESLELRLLRAVWQLASGTRSCRSAACRRHRRCLQPAQRNAHGQTVPLCLTVSSEPVAAPLVASFERIAGRRALDPAVTPWPADETASIILCADLLQLALALDPKDAESVAWLRAWAAKPPEPGIWQIVRKVLGKGGTPLPDPFGLAAAARRREDGAAVADQRMISPVAMR